MTYKELLDTTRKLRKNQTYEENVLWDLLRDRRLAGKKFLRQHPLIYQTRDVQYYFFVADFYCAENKLVIELDGIIHEYQKEKDYNRDLVINSMGLKVLRIKNHETDDLDIVKKKIIECF